MKICVLTGKRGGYDAMKPMLKKMQDDEFFDLVLYVCDMHLDDKFGRTVSEIKKDGFFFRGIPNLGSPTRSKLLSDITFGVASHLGLDKPDLLILYGDRGESLAAAMVALTFNIPIVHLQGGDRTGTQDDVMRDMISKAANVHFVSTEKAAGELFLLGEQSQRVFVVGDSHIDPIAERDIASVNEVSDMVGFDIGKSPPIIVLQHPDPTANLSAYEQMNRTLCAALDWRPTVIIYPCSDPGCDETIKAIEEQKSRPKVHIFKNLPGRIFRGLMSYSKCIVGNSSCGIIEAPYLKLPAVNVGRRQEGRLRCGNTTDVDYNTGAIAEAIKRVTGEHPSPYKLLYGHGETSSQIIDTLKGLDPRLLEPKPMRRLL